MPQINAADVALAQLSLDAYRDAPTFPAGFTAPPLSVSTAPGASYSNGVFHAGNGAALVSTGLLNGEQTLVVAFRGSDDRVDSLHDMQGINAAYADFGALVQAVDAYAATGAVQQVVVTGHSLGGAMAQLYMASHPETVGSASHEAVTFGSPGALMASAGDARIDNIVIADDPAVLLGAHRAEVGAVLQADPHLAQLAAQEAVQDFPGITAQDALASLPFLNANYVNNGDITLLPGASGQLDVGAVAQVAPQEHAAELYLARTMAAAAGTLATFDVPQQPVTPEQALDRAVYAGDYPDGSTAQALVDQAITGWAASHSLTTEAQHWLASVQHDLALL